MDFWFVVKTGGNILIYASAIFMSWTSLPDALRKKGVSVVKEAKTLRPWSVRLVSIIATVFISLYFMAIIKQDWLEWRQLRDDPLKTEALNLADYIAAKVSRWSDQSREKKLSDSQVQGEIWNEFSGLGQWIDNVRHKLRAAGQPSDTLDQLLNVPLQTASLEHLAKMPDVIRRLANNL